MYKAVSDRELNYLTSRLVNKIDNKIDIDGVVEEAAPYKILKLDKDGKFPADILTGTIPLDNIPKGALERCVIVSDDEARFALTIDDVQVGDTVKVLKTNKMFYVKDDEFLYDEAGYEIYSSGSAEKLTTGRDISLAGDIEGSALFDGTKNIIIDTIIKMLTGPLVLGEKIYGDTLPPNAEKGTLYLKRVPGSTISTKVIVLAGNMYGAEAPTGDEYKEDDIFFLQV